MTEEKGKGPRIVVFGAGAVGCFVGGAWQDAGLDVTFIGRARIAEQIREHGLKLSDNKGYAAHLPAGTVKYTTDTSLLKNADVIALSVKNTGTGEAAEEIAAHTGAEVPVIVLQNGVGNVERLEKLLPGRQILAGMVPYNVAALGDGHWYKGTPGHVAVGKAPVTEAMAEVIGDHPIRLVLEEDMEPIIWGKLLLNLNNAVNALSGISLLEELMQRGYRKVIAACIRETLEVLKAKKIEPAKVGTVPPSVMPAFFDVPDLIYHPLVKGRIDPRATSSMADDFNAGRPTEIDFLNGEVVRAAEVYGIATPANRKVIALVRDAEKGGRRNWSADELAIEVLGKS